MIYTLMLVNGLLLGFNDPLINHTLDSVSKITNVKLCDSKLTEQVVSDALEKYKDEPEVQILILNHINKGCISDKRQVELLTLVSATTTKPSNIKPNASLFWSGTTGGGNGSGASENASGN